MATRLTNFSSLRSKKQQLVKILFHEKYTRKGKDAHRNLVDSSSYTYEKLRYEYLKRIQEIHPDKHHHQHHSTKTNDNNNNMHDKFIELSNAWDQYDTAIRLLIKTTDVEKTHNANFTLFGVGCSFSDSNEEREIRSIITDQACRGWFSSGELPITNSMSISSSSDDNNNNNNEFKSEQQQSSSVVTSLCDDDMFVEVNGNNESSSSTKNPSFNNEHGRSNNNTNRRRSLVDDAMIRKKL